MVEAERLKDKFPAIAAAAAATVAATVLSSFTGTAGTLAGMGIASVLSGTLTHLFQQGILRSHRAAKERLERYKKSHLRGVMTFAEYDRLYRPRAEPQQKPFRWKTAAVLSGVTLVISLAVITGVELAARKPLSDVVTGHKGAGLTVTGGGSQQQPQAPVAPSPSPSSSLSPSPSPSPSASFSPSPGPSASPSAAPSLSGSPAPSTMPDTPASSPPSGTETP